MHASDGTPSHHIRVYRDAESGCWYVVHYTHGGITPRLRADGRVDCPKVPD